ncbi:hypothetical protein PRIPAC_70236 [Pristionchus pacificus]|uniref:Uncharacterized protein n=1 Tax=Pristionchus pacificus TaxID=54126 RepID=A0A2A6BZK2_PRIPA|nr:hypothetical protein PRIPAC_70236 [Pristionchus pacificus]|eukprot:PDM71310.1 hypothetical protein PRIPAC_37717 [Pristionchus pacificus]
MNKKLQDCPDRAILQLHGRDELWLQQQQRQRVMDAETAAVLQSKAVASRSTPAIVRPSEKRPDSSPPPFSLLHLLPLTPDQHTTPPAFGTHSTPVVVRPSEQTTPDFGSRSTTAVVRPNEARETTGEQTTPAFGTRSKMVPEQSKPRQQQQQQSGRKEAPTGIWRL